MDYACDDMRRTTPARTDKKDFHYFLGIFRFEKTTLAKTTKFNRHYCSYSVNFDGNFELTTRERVAAGWRTTTTAKASMPKDYYLYVKKEQLRTIVTDFELVLQLNTTHNKAVTSEVTTHYGPTYLKKIENYDFYDYAKKIYDDQHYTPSRLHKKEQDDHPDYKVRHELRGDLQLRQGRHRQLQAQGGRRRRTTTTTCEDQDHEDDEDDDDDRDDYPMKKHYKASDKGKK